MNVADSIYFKLYSLVDSAIYNGFIVGMGQLRGFFLLATTIAVVLIGYKMLYPSNENTLLTAVKSMVVVLVVSTVILWPAPIYETIKTVMIDIPIAFAGYTVGGMLESLGYTAPPIDMTPSAESQTLFGSLWEFINLAAGRLIKEAGISNMSLYFIAAGLYIAGLLLIALMIMLMGTALIMASVVILATPVFMWMLMFKNLRPMFDGWLKIGMTATVGIFLLLNMIGILMAFMDQMFVEAFQVSLFVPDSMALIDDGVNTDLDLENVGMSILFMIIVIKMLPQTQSWATTIGGAIGTNISAGALDIGKAISQKMTQGAGKLGVAAAEPMKDSVTNLGNDIKEGASNVRDRMMQDRIASNMRQVNDSNNNDLSETQGQQGETQQSEPAQIPEKDVYFNQAPQPEAQQPEREPVEVGTANNESQQQNIEVTNINNQDERQEVRNDVDVKQEAPQEPEPTDDKGENEAPEATEKEPHRQEAKEFESTATQQPEAQEAPQPRQGETVKSVEIQGHNQAESREQEQAQSEIVQGNTPGQNSDGNKPGENESQDNAPADSDKDQEKESKRNESKEFKQDD